MRKHQWRSIRQLDQGATGSGRPSFRCELDTSFAETPLASSRRRLLEFSMTRRDSSMAQPIHWIVGSRVQHMPKVDLLLHSRFGKRQKQTKTVNFRSSFKLTWQFCCNVYPPLVKLPEHPEGQRRHDSIDRHTRPWLGQCNRLFS